MQTPDKIRDRSKFQNIQTLASASIRPFALLNQRSVTNTCTNTSFLRLLSSIMKTMISMLQHLDEKQACLIKERNCFNCKEREHRAYEYSKKEKIAAILKGFIKNNNCQEKN